MARHVRYQYEAGDAERPPSRSRKKRDSTALQAIGEELARMPRAKLDAMPLPPDLRAALEEYHQLGRHEAKRRQLQYIGRLMREAKEEGALDDLLQLYSPPAP